MLELDKKVELGRFVISKGVTKIIYTRKGTEAPIAS